MCGPANDSDRLSTLRILEARGRLTARTLTGRFAWPTVVLFLGVLAGVGGVAALTVTGHLSYWAAIPIKRLSHLSNLHTAA